ncbi:hypothetical protein C3747_118g148 [Trypanosoma cruzi]|uniref:Uncharacterized protein n=1 Tax=Trypanosoma cruzi TaxID=5693 RepID=A0A2V2WHL7_TRYCR|nr:hypothetical protein C3747_118g148 [Trypanosoma cruzi]
MRLRDVSARHHDAARANTPCGFSGVARTVPFVATVPPSPSVGADVSVDASSYRLRTHSLIDAADTPAHCCCFLHDCCTAPSSWCSGTGDENAADQFQSDGAGTPVSVPPTPATHPHHRRAQKSKGQGRHRRSVRTSVVFPHHSQSNSRKNLQQHQSLMKKEQRPPPTATAAPRSPTPLPILCILLSRMRAAAVVPGLHEVVCAEYERRPKGK